MIFPIFNKDRERYEAVKAEGNILLVGLTGGIASGKSTVAGFIKELGAVVIDFDILARKVVSPGEKAWFSIVEYFGEEILLDNREIDRKKISGLVFLDAEKRKRLEEFTHPAIGEEFVKEVEKAAAQKRHVVILGVVPLLIECGMQELFHAIALVYIPRETQIDRLTKRDGITRERAIDIINAQMPIDEKIGHADFVINNNCSVEETKIQVKGFWDRLIELQQQRKYQGR
jgi:dephospho-CoA kinase